MGAHHSPIFSPMYDVNIMRRKLIPVPHLLHTLHALQLDSSVDYSNMTNALLMLFIKYKCYSFGDFLLPKAYE